MPSIISADRLKSLEDDQKKLGVLSMHAQEIEKELEELKKRVRDVESAYTEKTGLQIRNDITRVFVKFSKVEMITMMAGVYGLMKNCVNTGDVTMYSELVQKLQGFINKMEDDDANVG
jgi:tetrahydromethanopterin S-methyltransferase subunit G